MTDTLTEDEKQEYLRNLENLVTARTEQLKQALAWIENMQKAIAQARDILNEALIQK